MAAIAGMRSELIDHIETINAQVDLATGPQTIMEYMEWNCDNLSTWEHPGYVDPVHDANMEELAKANAAAEVRRLEEEHFFRSLHTCLSSEH